MEIVTATEELYLQLLQRRNDILGLPVPITERYQKIICATYELLASISLLLKNESLPDITTEITFFKKMLPPFYAIGIYYTMLLEMEVTKPIGSSDSLTEWYKGEFNKICTKDQQQGEFNRYY